jgi:L-seryl-tRNA(Ser) seleniumtransferase
MIFGRRPFLGALGSLPIFSRAGLAAPRRRDVISELGVRTFINAAGTYTMLTASLMPEEVFEAMRETPSAGVSPNCSAAKPPWSPPARRAR